MADRKPDKVPDKMDPEKRKKKTSHLYSSEIEAALNADEETTPKSSCSVGDLISWLGSVLAKGCVYTT